MVNVQCSMFNLFTCRRIDSVFGLPGKQVSARQEIFVTRLGRKFRRFSLTMQRYDIFIAVYEFSPEKFHTIQSF